MGGVGMRRGRRDPDAPAVGDTLDFWRVEAYEPGRRLRLAAEMKVPGRAWLEFEVVPAADGAVVHQTAVFEPVGLSGLLYWYVLLPVHALIFGGLLRAIARRALSRSCTTAALIGLGTILTALTLVWMLTRPVLAVLFGAAGGPIAFLAGERPGAVTLLPPLGQSLFAFNQLGGRLGRLFGVVRRVAPERDPGDKRIRHDGPGHSAADRLDERERARACGGL